MENVVGEETDSCREERRSSKLTSKPLNGLKEEGKQASNLNPFIKSRHESKKVRLLRRRHQKILARPIGVITTYYIVTLLLFYLLGAVALDVELSEYLEAIIFRSALLIHKTNYAINFFVFVVGNKEFRVETRNLLFSIYTNWFCWWMIE